jgi:predicted Rossmann fold flavoprotein
VTVIGGGSAGMVAAIAAARRGAAVTLLERMPRVGKKLLATGNGRCNLANARLGVERFHGERPPFALAALGRFGLDATLAFFRDLGIEPREEEGGRIYPRSGQASSVLDVLRHELERLGVETRCETEATGIAARRGGWEVRTREGALRAGAVVLAGGGRASPQLGSNGGALELARALGHRIVEPFPALTRVRASSPVLRHLKGVKVDGAATLAAGRETLQQAAGEILFTETGLSGPPILDLSRLAGARARRGERTLLRLDLCPELDPGALVELLAGRFGGRGGRTAEFALVGFIHKRLIAPLLREGGVSDPGAPASSLDAAQVRAVAAAIKGWGFEVTGTDSWTDAQVTAGGIATDEVDPRTLCSLRAPGLHLAGEVLDIDGDCGGYNLQWAWSSGHVAGAEAAGGGG